VLFPEGDIMTNVTTGTTGTVNIRSGDPTKLTSGSLIAAEKVIDTNVYNPQGEKLGEVDDLMIDKHSGHIRYAVLEFGGFLGMGTDRYPIPWNVLRYDTERDGYVVPLDKNILDKAPRYRTDSVPVYDNDYGSRIDRYYHMDA